jgi:hypothetical protein
MREHHTLRVTDCARCKHYVTAHARPLIFYLPQNYSVLNFSTQRKGLSPVIDLDVWMKVAVLC